MRAYLVITKAEFGWLKSGTIMIQCKVKNSGQSPAKRVQCSGKVTFFGMGEVGLYTSTARPDERHAFEIDICSGEELEANCSVDMPAEAFADIHQNGVLISAYLKVVGTDIFETEISQTAKFARRFKALPQDNKWLELARDSEVRLIDPGDHGEQRA